jgi:uncharacterized MAPEG superfamily protein
MSRPALVVTAYAAGCLTTLALIAAAAWVVARLLP